MSAARVTPGRNPRRGLRKLECADGCGCKAYMTFHQLEQHGLPVCACGGCLAPEDLEVAGALCVDAPVLADYQRELAAVIHGQAPHARRGREVQPAEQLAAERVAKDRADRATAARLQALHTFNPRRRPGATDPIPF